MYIRIVGGPEAKLVNDHLKEKAHGKSKKFVNAHIVRHRNAASITPQLRVKCLSVVSLDSVLCSLRL